MPAPERAEDQNIGRDDFNSDQSFPAKLTQNYIGKAKTGQGRVWCLTFERHDRQFSDGNPCSTFVTLAVTKRDGTPMWPEADANRMAGAYEALIGVSLMPKDLINNEMDPDEAFIGETFILENENVAGTDREGKPRKPFYVAFPKAYEGANFEYTGAVTTVEPRTDEDREAIEDAKETKSTEDDIPRAKALVTLLVGLTKANIIGKGAALKAVNEAEESDLDEIGLNKKLLKCSVKGSLTVPPGQDRLPILITKLEKEGLLHFTGKLEKVAEGPAEETTDESGE